MKKLILCCMILIMGFTSQAQSKKEKKLQEAIDALESTEFVKSYQDCKLRVEKIATDFKLQEEFFEAEDVEKVRLQYTESKEEFEKILEHLKKKLMNKKYRKYLIENPEDFTELIQMKLEKAMINYEENCVQLITEISGTEAVGFGISDIIFLVNMVGDIAGAIKGIGKQLDKMNELYIEEKFINKLRIQAWEDL